MYADMIWPKAERFRGPLLLAAAAGSLAVFVALPQPAHAQFVCANDVTKDGDDADASGANSNNFACGTRADASGNRSRNTATGNRADASGRRSRNTATGRRADASGNDSRNTATGREANASGNASENTATGNRANASGVDSTNVAVGALANASGDNTSNTAVGASSTATGQNASAFGTGASATHANSAAFGWGATTTRDNQQVFGTETNTYTMTGIASQASRVAQEAGGGPEYLVTTNAGGDLAAHTFAELGIASAGTVARNSARIDENTKGVAMAMAMSSAVPYLLPTETFAMSVSWGTFEGENGGAIGARIGINKSLSVAGAGSFSSDGSFGGTVSSRIGW